jgi:hypothetical protein
LDWALYVPYLLRNHHCPLPLPLLLLLLPLLLLCWKDNWEEAVDLFGQLKGNQLGVRPNTVTYNILMSACLARDKPQHVSCCCHHCRQDP